MDRISNVRTNQIDKWPANLSEHIRTVSTSTLSNSDKSKFPKATRVKEKQKPKFLSTLEKQIDKDLAVLNPADVEGRISVFREAFLMLVGVFKTYQPLFYRILDEFDIALKFYKSEIKKLVPLRACVWTIYEECDQRVQAIQSRENKEIDWLKENLAKVRGIMNDRFQEIASLKEEIRHLIKSVQEEHERYRHEADSKRLLIAHINELRSHYEELQSSVKRTNEVGQPTDDPVILRMALENTQKTLSEVQIKLEKMQVDYQEVVPKRELEVLTKLAAEHDSKMSEQHERYDELLNLYRNQEQELEEMLRQRNAYNEALKQVHNESTPRPNWDEVGTKLPCGLAKWMEDTYHMSSRQKVKHLIEQLTEDGRTTKTFKSKGTGEEIPRFLRYGGETIPQSPLGLQDCLLLTHEIWSMRKAQKDKVKVKRKQTTTSKSAATSETFDEFLEGFFVHAFGIPQYRLQLVYAFYNALDKHTDCVLLKELKDVIDNVVRDNIITRLIKDG